MKIANKKTEVPSGIELNDKDYYNRILTSLKELVKNYAISLTEVSNETLYQKYFEQFKNITSMQREIFEIMFQNGWYELETAETSKINNKYNSLMTDFESIKDNK